jgi:hypothetical protein
MTLRSILNLTKATDQESCSLRNQRDMKMLYPVRLLHKNWSNFVLFLAKFII